MKIMNKSLNFWKKYNSGDKYEKKQKKDNKNNVIFSGDNGVSCDSFGNQYGELC